MKGIVLAGGKGTRLGELTRVTNKNLLPVGNMPMVYHPIFKLTEAGITDIMVITGTEHMGDFVELLGSGRRFGCQFTFRVQDEAGGIAQALGLAEGFCRDDKCVVLLADNIFEDHLTHLIENATIRPDDAFVLLKEVDDPTRFGVAVIEDGKLVKVIEKPDPPPSNYAVTGVYIYPPDVFQVIKSLKPSCRGELEITDVNNFYIEQGRMGWMVMDGYWTDAGTPESLACANRMVTNGK
jgi:glucose-1-phosphate thymidylyltransferase